PAAMQLQYQHRFQLPSHCIIITLIRSLHHLIRIPIPAQLGPLLAVLNCTTIPSRLALTSAPSTRFRCWNHPKNTTNTNERQVSQSLSHAHLISSHLISAAPSFIVSSCHVLPRRSFVF